MNTLNIHNNQEKKMLFFVLVNSASELNEQWSWFHETQTWESVMMVTVYFGNSDLTLVKDARLLGPFLDNFLVEEIRVVG